MLATLRDHQAELEAVGVVHLRLHGSVARGDASEASDVDLIADFDAIRKYSLLDRVALGNGLTGSGSPLVWGILVLRRMESAITTTANASVGESSASS